MKTILVSAVALIDENNRILMAQRPAGKAMAGLWEFPGGKVEPQELPEAALIRELKEELGIEVLAQDLQQSFFVSHTYEQENFHLLMLLYICRKWQNTPQANEGQNLAWFKLKEILNLPMPAADLPLVKQILHNQSN